MEDRAIPERSLLRISALLHATREMYASRGTRVGEVLQQHVRALISDMLPCEDCSIFLYDSGGGEWPAVVDQAVGERHPVLGETELAVPLQVRDGIAGALWLKRTEPFGDSEFQLASAIAQIASVSLENAFHLEWLQSEVKRLEQDLGVGHELLGDSAPMAELRSAIARVAPTDATVLITGESGTGKELVARAVHRHSRRAPKPFAAINCAALTETLLESELFGHEKGAFTGAVEQKRGKLEAANGGTVFLDEIGEMPIGLQAKLLRVLQQREVERVGGTKAIPLDFRLVAATNRNLEEAARRGTFRLDLYYRLNVISLKTPPLRKRPNDILPLAHHFVARYGAKCARKIAGISPEARALLRGYEWPGNVRELENAIERAVVLGCDGMIHAEDLPEALNETPGASESSGLLQDAVNAAKIAAVDRAFAKAGNKHEEAARLLGVHPNYLYRLMRNMGMRGE